MALMHINFHSDVLNMDTRVSARSCRSGCRESDWQEARTVKNYPVLWLLHGR